MTYNKRRRRDTDSFWETTDESYDYSANFNENSTRYENYTSFDDYFLTGNYSDYTCTLYQQQVCDTQFSVLWEDIREALNVTCYEPCEYEKYDVSVFTTKYPPTNSYFDSYINVDGDESLTFELARANLIRLHIFFDDIEYTENDQTAEYEIQNFIGELGGVVDLFIGFSFFTIFQLLEIAVAMFVVKCWRRKRKVQE